METRVSGTRIYVVCSSVRVGEDGNPNEDCGSMGALDGRIVTGVGLDEQGVEMSDETLEEGEVGVTCRKKP